jgi:hypothetical protein
MPELNEIIVKDLEILHGTPVFRGTRVPLQNLLDYLEGRETLDDFLGLSRKGYLRARAGEIAARQQAAMKLHFSIFTFLFSNF